MLVSAVLNGVPRQGNEGFGAGVCVVAFWRAVQEGESGSDPAVALCIPFWC